MDVDMKDPTHHARFSNLIDSKTGKRVRLEVPDDLMYEGRMLYTGVRAECAGHAVRRMLQEKE